MNVMDVTHRKIGDVFTSMKILHVISGEFYSGAERVQDMLAIEQLRRGHQVEFFRLRTGPFPDFLEAKVKLHTAPMRSRVDFEPAWQLAHLISQGGFDILHSHSPRSALICAFAARNSKIPVLHHLHGDSSRMHRSLLRNIFNTVTEVLVCGNFAIVSCSETVARYAERFHIGSRRRYIVENGINQPDLVWVPPSKPIKRIGAVGLQRYQKATDVLIKSLASVRAKDPSVILTVIGAFADSEYEKDMHQLATRLNVAKSIEWLGHRKDVLSILATLDVFVLPSRLEGLSLALLEAMSLGMPCIVSDIAANTNVITNEQTGLTFREGDDNALANQILRLLTDPEFAIRLGKKACRRFKGKYSVQTMAEKIDAIYDQLIGK